MDKNSLILNSIIKEYLKTKEPIGSEHLKKNMGLDISSATIRNYFKKMMDDGTLYQEHTSSGRVPTSLALREYWIDKLKVIDDLYISDLQSLEQKAKKLDIFCSIKFQKHNKLRIIDNAMESFLLAIFDDGQFVLEYNEQIETLLRPLIGTDIFEIRKFCKKLGIKNILRHIDFISKDEFHFVNKKAILKMLDYEDEKQEQLIYDSLSNKNFDEIQMGISFEKHLPQGIMLLKTKALIEGRSAEMICIGEIQKDFEYFFSL